MADDERAAGVTADDLGGVVPLLVRRLAEIADAAAPAEPGYGCPSSEPLLARIRGPAADAGERLRRDLLMHAVAGPVVGRVVDVARSYLDGRVGADEAMDSVVDRLAQAGLLGEDGE